MAQVDFAKEETEKSFDWNTYDLPEIDLSISIPDIYTTFVRNMPEDSPILLAFGMTSEEVDEMLVEDCFLQAYNAYDKKTIMVMSVDAEVADFNKLTLDDYTFLASTYRLRYENAEKSEPCFFRGYRYIRVSFFTDKDGSESLLYLTVCNQQMLMILFDSPEQITREDEALMRDIMNSIVLPDVMT